MATKPKQEDTEVFVMEVKQGSIEFCVLGTSPLICNRMSEKVKRELLLPAGKKNSAEKAASAKHDPLEEYRASPYTLDDGPTLIAVLASQFKGALRSAALDMPGAKKAQIGRLTYITGDRIPVYGVPKLMMSVTRSADMNKTPDVRTRAILPQWACQVRVNFVTPILREPAVANLLAASGIYIGIGDWRPEKGSGNYGQFRLVSATDPEYRRIVKEGGRAAQQAALKDPEAYDDETRSLFEWSKTEAQRRGFKVAA